MAESVMRLERTFAAPPAIVWAVLADTNRYNRAMKQGPTTFGWTDVGGLRHRTAEAVRGSVHMTWIEPPFEWIEGRYLASHRDFTSGPIESGGLRIDVEPEGEGSRVRMAMTGIPRALALKIIAPIVRMVLKSEMRRWLDTVEEVLAKAPRPAAGVPPVAPPRSCCSRRPPRPRRPDRPRRPIAASSIVAPAASPMRRSTRARASA
jgi:hypothetical protein